LGTPQRGKTGRGRGTGLTRIKPRYKGGVKKKISRQETGRQGREKPPGQSRKKKRKGEKRKRNYGALKPQVRRSLKKDGGRKGKGGWALNNIQ